MGRSVADAAIAKRIAAATTTEAGVAPGPALGRLLVTDGSTGLYNRPYFEERLTLELEKATAEKPCALLLVDAQDSLDPLDMYGGDTIGGSLKALARALSGSTPDEAVVCRIDRARLAVVIPGCPQSDAEQARRANAQPVGLAVAPFDAIDAEGLLWTATADLYRQQWSQGDGAGIVSRVPPEAPLIGRDTLIERAEAWWDDVLAGSGRFLLLRGPSGVGKTRLAEELALEAAHRRFRVIHGVPTATAPLGAIRHAWGLLTEAAQANPKAKRRAPAPVNAAWMAPPLHAVDEPLTCERIAGDLRAAVAEAGKTEPVFWLLDDLPYADTTTLHVLEHLIEGLGGLRLLIVATAGSGDGSPGQQRTFEQWTGSIGRRPYVHSWELEPLTPADAVRLTAWAMGTGVPAELVKQQAVASGGNPLCILRLAAFPTPASETAPGPIRPENLFESHWRALPKSIQAVLAAAAVVGPGAKRSVLCGVAPGSPEGLLQALDALDSSGWIRSTRDQVLFTHATAREVAYRLTDVALRQCLHRMAGHVLARELDHPAALVAWHFEQAGDWGRALVHHKRAGDAAASVSAGSEAAFHYQRHLELSAVVGQVPSNAPSLALKTGDLYRQAQNLSSALEVVQNGLSFCQSDADRGRLLLKLAQLQLQIGQVEDVLGVAEEAVQRLQAAGAVTELPEALVYRLRAKTGSEPDFAESAQAAVVAARQWADPAAAVASLCQVGELVSAIGRFDLARECLQAIRTVLKAAAVPPSPIAADLLVAAAELALRLGEPDIATQWTRMGRRAGTNGQASVGASVRLTIQEARALLFGGHVPKALRLLERVASKVHQTADPMLEARWQESRFMALLFAHRLEEAAHVADGLRDRVRPLGTAWQRYAQSLADLVRLNRGERVEPSAGWSINAVDVDALDRSRQAQVYLVAAQISLYGGRVAEAAQFAKAQRQRSPAPVDQAHLGWLEGRIYMAQEEWAKATAAFRSSTAEGGMTYFQAMAHRDLAALLMAAPQGRRKGMVDNKTVVRGHIEAARRLFERMGNKTELQRLSILERINKETHLVTLKAVAVALQSDPPGPL